MKKKLILATATIASVAAPLATVVACGSETHHSLNYKMGDDLIKGVSGTDFFKKDDVYKETFKSDLSKYDNQVLFTLYDVEVKAAVKLQLGTFKFDIFKKETEKAKIKEEVEKLKLSIAVPDILDDAKAALETQKTSKNTRISTITTEISEINDKIKLIGVTAETGLKASDYNSTSFGSKFGLMLKPFKYIKADKLKYFNDQKNNHFNDKTFSPNERAAKWPEVMRKKFGGATTPEEATTWLASNSVKNYARAAYSFRVNNSYTVEQYVWANITGNTDWGFLTDANKDTRIHIDATYKTDVTDYIAGVKTAITGVNGHVITKVEDVVQGYEDVKGVSSVNDIETVKNKKVFFLASNSKGVTPFGETEDKFVTEEVTGSSLIKVQNGIIPFLRPKNPHQAWTIKEPQLKTLLRYYGKGNNAKQGISFFFDSQLYGTNPADSVNNKASDKDFTTMALHMGTTDSTSDIQGSLGFKETLEYVRTMQPGFGVGVLAIQAKVKDTSLTIPDEKEVNGTTLVGNLKTKLDALYTKNNITHTGTTTTTQKNEELDKLFEAMKGKISAEFGGVVRDYFQTIDGAGKNGGISYKIAGKDNYNHIVLSATYGIHVIRITQQITMKDDVSNDLDNMAKEQKLVSSTGITGLINANYAKGYVFYKKVLADATLKASLTTKLGEYNTANGSKEEDKLTIPKLEEMIKRIESSEGTKKVALSLGASQINWYKGELDAKLKDPTLTVDQLYAAAKAVAS